MTALKQQAITIIDKIPDEKLGTLIDLMKMLVQPASEYSSDDKQSVRIGLARDRDLYNPEYDFDEYNVEIAKLFGATS